MRVTKSEPVFEVGDTVIVGTGNPADGYPNDTYVLHDGDIFPPVLFEEKRAIAQADGDPGDCNDAQIP